MQCCRPNTENSKAQGATSGTQLKKIKIKKIVWALLSISLLVWTVCFVLLNGGKLNWEHNLKSITWNTK